MARPSSRPFRTGGRACGPEPPPWGRTPYILDTRSCFTQDRRKEIVMKNLKTGVVGLGRLGRVHAHNIRYQIPGAVRGGVPHRAPGVRGLRPDRQGSRRQRLRRHQIHRHRLRHHRSMENRRPRKDTSLKERIQRTLARSGSLDRNQNEATATKMVRCRRFGLNDLQTPRAR